VAAGVLLSAVLSEQNASFSPGAAAQSGKRKRKKEEADRNHCLFIETEYAVAQFSS
jgi:hypothetical protein